MIKDLAKDIPLFSITGVIAHVLKEESTYPKGNARPRPILTSILLYLLTTAVTPTGRNRSRIMRLADWNPNSICNKKLKLVQFPKDRGIDICLINAIHLVPGQDFRMPNDDCRRNDGPTQGVELGSLSVVPLIIIPSQSRPTTDGSHRHMCNHWWEASQTRGGLSITIAIPA